MSIIENVSEERRHIFCFPTLCLFFPADITIFMLLVLIALLTCYTVSSLPHYLSYFGCCWVDSWNAYRYWTIDTLSNISNQIYLINLILILRYYCKQIMFDVFNYIDIYLHLLISSCCFPGLAFQTTYALFVLIVSSWWEFFRSL